MCLLFACLLIIGCCENHIALQDPGAIIDHKAKHEAMIQSDNSIVVSILIDSSGSMSGRKWRSVKDVLFKLSNQLNEHQLKNGNLYVVLYTFRSQSEMFLFDKTRFDQIISNLGEPSGGTPLGEVTRHIFNCMPGIGKNHLFILTDGLENGRVSTEDVLRENQGRASVYFVAFDFDKRHYERLGQFAQMFQADNVDELGNVTFEIFQRNILVERED